MDISPKLKKKKLTAKRYAKCNNTNIKIFPLIGNKEERKG